MSKHELLDTMVATVGGLYGNTMKFFSEGVDGTPLPALTQAIEAKVPAWDGIDEYGAKLETPAGSITVPFNVLQWAGPGAPTLIFHHGSGDIPYHGRLRKILSGSTGPEASVLDGEVNLIATNSPFNDSRKSYYRAIRDLERFGILIAGSAALIEALIVSLPECGRVVVSGISLGGWVANLHHAVYDTAHEYRPIFAGAALDALFTDSAYSKLTAKVALEVPEQLAHCLNFEKAFAKRPNATVYPLLARFDQYIRFGRQSGIYREDRLSALERGHITGSGDNDALKAFLEQAFVPSRAADAASVRS